MHVQTHLLAGWGCANLLPCTPRQRAAAMVAAIAPDVDGVAILFGTDAYQRLHHTFGHNLYFAVIVSGLLAGWARPAVATFLLCFAMAHLHLFMDYWGSGPLWHIHYLWPRWEPVWRNRFAWEFYSWQNMVAFAAVLAWAAWIAWRYRRTPLEGVMPDLDRQLVAVLPVHGRPADALQRSVQGAVDMSNTSVTKVSSGSSPKGAMGQKYLASGISMAMRLWDKEQPGEAKPAEAREYETVGYVVGGRAELHIEGQVVQLEPGDSWVVNKGQKHTYKILEPFTAVEATHPPARAGGRDQA